MDFLISYQITTNQICMQMIFREKYTKYKEALNILDIQTLADRREALFKKF